MLGAPIIIKRGGGSEAEKPFWISYADLMTALMVLFLVVMSVALLAVTKTVSEIERRKTEREQDITRLLGRIVDAARHYPGIKIDLAQHTINFGDKASFEKGRFTLRPEQMRLLRAFVPEILSEAHDPLGEKWLKQIVVEGFASPEGDYLYNLNLSLQRSQNVLCAFFAPPFADEHPLTAADYGDIRDLFLVGGYAFNAVKYDAATNSYADSRRVELKLEFLGIGEARAKAPAIPGGHFGHCALQE